MNSIVKIIAVLVILLIFSGCSKNQSNPVLGDINQSNPGLDTPNHLLNAGDQFSSIGMLGGFNLEISPVHR